MAYGFVQDVPANEEMYEQIRGKLGGTPPAGMVAHVVLKRDGGLRYIDVWDSRADWERFRTEKVEPAVGEVLAAHGLPHDHSMVMTDDVDVVDVWLGPH